MTEAIALLKRILNARVRDVLPEPTPLSRAVALSERFDGRDVWIKREDLTPVFSFKLRGAYNRIAQLDADTVAAGIIAASAGNHAQGVAFAARRRGASCTIVMPKTTPSIKVEAVRRLGAKVILVGDSYSDAAKYCESLAAETGLYFVHPFDDMEVIAGQGTVGMEILVQAPHDLRAIFVPIGGGGLAAGVGAYVKSLRPDVEIIGVEPDDSDAMAQSVASGHRIELDHVGIFADGVAVKQVGRLTFDLCQRYVDRIVRVSSDEICAAIKDGFEATRTILEGAGALAIAGAKQCMRAGTLAPGPIVAIASGANISFNRLRYITERTEIGEQKEGLFAVRIPESPGNFYRFYRALGQRAVTEFNYRLGRRDAAQVLVGVELSRTHESNEIVAQLNNAGFSCVDLGGDELVKTHVRYLAGGRAPEVQNERLFEFEFPERAGALDVFLGRLGSRWNISLFHYRNHGGSIGRVLCGFEVLPEQSDSFLEVLRSIGFAFREVENNPAVERFLQ